MQQFTDFVNARPMVAKSAKNLDDALKFCTVAENKLDGMRIFLVKYPDGTWDVLSRSLKSQKGKMPHIDAITQNLPLGTVLDGEAILFHGGKTGTLTYEGADVPVHFPDFADTMRIMRSNPDKAVARQKDLGVNVSVVVFDMPWHDNKNLCDLTLRSRRALMEPVINDINHPNLNLSPLVDLSQENIDRVFALGGEGIMAKNIDKGSEYVAGARTSSWRKLKFVATSDVVIIGHTAGQGKYSDNLGAIEYGQYLNGKLTRRGRCSGMTDAMRTEVYHNIEKYVGKVMEIAHMGIAKDGHRHPRFVCLRDDKLDTDCIWDTDATVEQACKTTDNAGRTKTVAKAATKAIKIPAPAKTAKPSFDDAEVIFASDIIRQEVGNTNKYYQVFVSKEGDDYFSWAAYGRWDSDANAPKTRQTTALPYRGTDLEKAKTIANAKLNKKLGSGYRTSSVVA